MRRRRTAWAVLVAVSLSGTAGAYPFMIRRDYAACGGCHADPSGGSLLTRYGRASGELLLRSQYGAPEDRDPGTLGNFMFGAFELPENVLLGMDLRGLLLTGGASAVRAFPMQVDAVAQVAFWGVRANGSVGYGQGRATEPIALVHLGDPQLVSRHHWLGVDLGEDKEWLVRLGRMNLPFGLRSIEHTQWIRSETRSDTNVGQRYGLAAAYSTAGLRGELMAIASRELGYSGYFELAPFTQLAVGVSSLVTHSELDVTTGAPAWRHAHGVFARFTPHRLLVVSTEHDLTRVSGPGAAWGLVSMLQLDLEPYQGIHLMATGEARSRGAAEFGGWGSIAWFFAPHADLRADLVWAPATAAGRTATFMLQLHFFL
ncbi:MAG: hypothetical protein ACYC8T_00420 [Myxococcaceae bacterium]